MAKEYNSKSFKVLTDYESIRLSPGMYIGQTSSPTHLVEEVLDNAFDECLAGYANIVMVEYDSKNNIFSISDNGRGIPVEKDIPITISTFLNSGAKFKGSRDVYEICSGRHGVGLVAVNALSDFFKIEIVRKSVYSIFEFKKFRLFKKFSAPIVKKTFSTKITFKPDKKIFESLVPDISRIRDRLLIASIHLQNCVFVLIVDGEKEIIKLNTDEYFVKYCLSENEEITKIINISVKDKREDKGFITVEKLNLKLCYSLNGAITPKILGSVNLLPVEGGGTHIKLLSGMLKDILSSYGKKMNRRFVPQDTVCGLRVYIDLSLAEPEFGGQTKTQLINRKSYLEKLFNKVKRVLDLEFSKNPDQLDMILKRFEDYRIKTESRKEKVNIKSRGLMKFTKLRDCKNHPDGELFIVEGDSAAGSFLQCRNSRLHGIMPLKGKIPNVAIKGMNIIENQEVKEIISAVGCDIGPNFNISKLRYDKIILNCDADCDGGHINCLLIALFGYLMPEIIKHEKLFICYMPLFAISKEKMFRPIWTESELEKVRIGKYTNYIGRYKGIGSLSPWQLKICALDEKIRKLIKVEYSKDIKLIMRLLSEPAEKRKLLGEDL